MAAGDDWGQASVNNTNGFGKGAENNTISWGLIQGNSYGHPRTNLTGGGGFIGLLDTYSGAAAAYSLRQLSSSYTGAAITVRRTSDNAEQDIGFVNNELDTASLLSFVGAGDGFVTTIYDQSGNNHDMAQVTDAEQGYIVKSGLVELLNSKPIITRNANNTGYVSSYNIDTSQKSYVFCGKNASVSQNCCLLGSEAGSADLLLICGDNTSTTVTSNVVESNLRFNGASFSYSTRLDVLNATFNQTIMSSLATFSYGNNLCLGFRESNPSGLGMYDFQEMVIWDNNTDQIQKETNLNTYYGAF